MNNPFFYGNPAQPLDFLGRRRELHRIVSKIAGHGQSTAIVGEPRSGRTSLLLYLSASELQTNLYGECAEHLVFSYLDAQTLGKGFSQSEFWECALTPFFEVAVAPSPDSPLAQAYKMCQDNDFGTFVLERLLAKMKSENWRVVLMLDEFDLILHHPVLNSGEFFGSLRSLTSRSRGALALVIASRRSLADLNKATQQFSFTGSPYFNFLNEITLGSWPDKDVEDLLSRASDRFTAEERSFVKQVAGGHPYLLQIAAHELWEAYEEGEKDPVARRQQVGERLLDEASRTLDNTWQLWSPTMRQAFTAVALTDIPRLLKYRRFDKKGLALSLRSLDPELQALDKRGFILQDETASGSWRVHPQVFLWWLASELEHTMRDETTFEKWFQQHELGTFLSRSQKDKLIQTTRTVGGLLKGGVGSLIEITASGLMEAAIKGP